MDLRNKVETVLFAAGKSVSIDEIAELTSEKKSKIKDALLALQSEYEKATHSFAVSEGVRGWKMNVKEDFLQLARKIVADTELETPVLETLAVVAWKRPILQSEVIKIRGDGAYQHLRELLDLGFVSREPQGRSFKLKLAEKFFDYFDVEGDQEIRELFSVVKRPEPKPKEQKKIGDLDVVNIQKDNQEKLDSDLSQGKLGELEVQQIDPLEKRQRDIEELDDIEKELAKISKRTDEHLEDFERFKPQEDEGTEGSEDGAEVIEVVVIEETEVPQTETYEAEEESSEEPKQEDSEKMED